MALWRMPSDYLFGTLSQAAAVGDTSISSAAFANLLASYTTSAVLPLVLHNPSTGVREVVWVTAHTAAATSVTVVRGKEGTSAQAWPSGTQWICAPTAARDGLPVLATTALNAMTDQHVGMRALNSDLSAVWEWTYSAGWQPEIGQCRASDVAGTAAGTTVPTNATIQSRMGNVVSASPSSGIVAVTYSTPFPNGVIGGLSCSTWGTQFTGSVTLDNLSTSSVQLRPVQGNGTPPGVCSLFWIVWGW